MGSLRRVPLAEHPHQGAVTTGGARAVRIVCTETFMLDRSVHA